MLLQVRCSKVTYWARLLSMSWPIVNSPFESRIFHKETNWARFSLLSAHMPSNEPFIHQFQIYAIGRQSTPEWFRTFLLVHLLSQILSLLSYIGINTLLSKVPCGPAPMSLFLSVRSLRRPKRRLVPSQNLFTPQIHFNVIKSYFKRRSARKGCCSLVPPKKEEKKRENMTYKMHFLLLTVRTYFCCLLSANNFIFWVLSIFL